MEESLGSYVMSKILIMSTTIHHVQVDNLLCDC